ncbi:unnamed protein product [Anisakis simplex]|uniref:Integrase n=1 Tax=Anisakis simplex TaxID=6269 RepID=A0A0M3KFT6_ANISI|nr:unnamed protein product [Anisakis simplex]
MAKAIHHPQPTTTRHLHNNPTIHHHNKSVAAADLDQAYA